MARRRGVVIDETCVLGYHMASTFSFSMTCHGWCDRRGRFRLQIGVCVKGTVVGAKGLPSREDTRCRRQCLMTRDVLEIIEREEVLCGAAILV